MNLITPKGLSLGDTIGVIAPASPALKGKDRDGSCPF